MTCDVLKIIFYRGSCGLKSPDRTKKPMLQKKPDRKELKGKVPTQNMYRNCNEAPRQQIRDMRLKVILMRGSPLDCTYLDRRGEQGINDESIDYLW